MNISQNVKDEIRNAVLNGKQATVSESNVNFNGWNGLGYIIIDSSTGAGAYKISGGSDGAQILAFLMIGFFILYFGFFVLGGGPIPLIWGAGWIGAALTMLDSEDRLNWEAMAVARAMVLIISVMFIPFEFVPTVLLAVILSLMGLLIA